MARCRIEVQKMAIIWWYSQAFIEETEESSPRFWGRTSEAAQTQAESWAVRRLGGGGVPGERIGDPESYAYHFAVSRSADGEGEALPPGEVA